MSCCCGWRKRNYATNGPAAPTRNVAPPAVKAGWIPRPKAVVVVLGEDYTATPVNTVIPAGQSSVTTTITITPVDDNIAEGDEIARLSVKSSALTGSNGLGVTIEDNDTEPVEVVLTVSPDTLDEASGLTPLKVTASLVGQTSRQVDTVVTVTTTNGTATAGEDFDTATTTLTIPAGEMSAAGILNFTVTNDTTQEDNETLKLSGDTPGLTVTGTEVTIRDDDTAPTSISLSVTSSPITEDGASVSLPVQATLLGGGTRAEDTTVALRLVDLTATVGDDYTAAWGTTTLTIPAGEFSASTTLTITPVQDTFHEGTESTAVRGLNTDPGLPVNGVRINIRDDDPAPAQVKLEVDPGSISESLGSVLADVNAILVGDSTLTTDTRITTNLVSSDPKSRIGGGSLLLPLEIKAGESSGKSALVLLNLNDYVDDPDETLELRGTASNPDLTVLPGQVVILDDDTAGVAVSPGSLDVPEGQARRYSVNLDSEPTADVTVTVDVPAGAGFTVNPGTLTFTSQNWSSVQRVTVTALEDPDADDEPTATINHSVSSTDTLYDGVSTDGVDITVTDDDTNGVTVTPTELTVTEGSTATYTVVLDAQPTGTVTITVIDPTDNTDVSADPSILTFTTDNWGTAQTVTVSALHDQDNQDETATVKHSVSGYGAVTASDVDVTLEDDAPDNLAVSFGSAAYSVEEGSSITIQVQLDLDPERTVTIPITKSETGWCKQRRLLRGARQRHLQQRGHRSRHHLPSSRGHPGRQRRVGQAEPWRPAHRYSSGHHRRDRREHHQHSPRSRHCQPDGGNCPRGSHRAQYTVALTTQPTGNVTVTVNDPTDNTDVTADPASLTFSTTNWHTPQLVTVSATADSDGDQDNATITHTVSGYGSVTTADDVAVTVTETSLATVQINYAQAAYNVTEGNDVTITAVLSLDPERTLVIPLSPMGADGATSDDYSGVPDYLTFTSGETEKEFTFHAVDDTVDDDEEVFVGFGSLPPGVTVVAPRRARVRIEDNDIPESVTVSFGAPTYEVNEGHRANFKVQFSDVPERFFTLAFEWEYLGGGTPADLGSLFVSYPIHGESAEATVPQGTVQDHIDDDGESFKVTFGDLPEWLILGTPSQAVITIVDDDTAGVSLNLTTLPVDEGSNAEYTVVLRLPAHCRRDRGHWWDIRHGPVTGRDHPDLHSRELEYRPDCYGDRRSG